CALPISATTMPPAVLTTGSWWIWGRAIPGEIRALRVAGGFNEMDHCILSFSDNGADFTSAGDFVVAPGLPEQVFAFAAAGPHRYWQITMEYWGAMVPYEIGGYSELTPVMKDDQIPSSVASVAQVVAARAYTDTQMAAEVSRANGAYAAQGIFTGSPMALPFG